MIEYALYWAVFLFSLTFHEFSHAFVADKLGDPTPRANGRLSLNPLRHLDPLGTLMLLVARFGWAKPVEIDIMNLSNPRRDSGLVALAGPASNLFLAGISALLLHSLPLTPLMGLLFYTAILTNITLAVFNLVPVFPLDGEKILTALLPRDLALEYHSIMRRYGTIILILLLLPSPVGSPITHLIGPAITRLVSLLAGV